MEGGLSQRIRHVITSRGTRFREPKSTTPTPAPLSQAHTEMIETIKMQSCFQDTRETHEDPIVIQLSVDVCQSLKQLCIAIALKRDFEVVSRGNSVTTNMLHGVEYYE
jgi:hypothetical protein